MPLILHFAFCLLTCLSASSPLYAVDTLTVSSPDPILEDWRWTSFTEESGLAGGVWDIYEDLDGDIWFATSRGVQRYDGIRWTTYTTEDGLPDNVVLSVTQTSDGAMWFGTIGSLLTRYDPSAPEPEAWRTFDFENPGAQSSPTLIQTTDGSLWAGIANGGGLWKSNGTTWTKIETPPWFGGTVRELLQATDGTIWLTSFRQGVFRFDPSAPTDPQAWSRYTTTGLADNTVTAMLQTRDGAIWFADGPGRVSRFDPRIKTPSTAAWKTYTVSDGLPASILTSLWVTDEGTLWACGQKGAICFFDGTRWQTYEATHRPWRNARLGARACRNGVVWLWDHQGQAYRFNSKGTQWTVYQGILSTGRLGASFSGAPDVIFALDEELWFADRDGVVQYDREHWIKHTAANDH